MPDLDEYRRLNTRKASALQIGGFRPTLDPSASAFGGTPLVLPGEGWPQANGVPLLFVCQMNLATAPAVPPLLADIKFLTFFADPELSNPGEENGSNWVLRTYKSLDGLVPLAPPQGAPVLKKRFECLWQEVEDHPNSDDPERVAIKGVRKPRNFDNVIRTKVGGYASTIQAEPWWGSKAHPSEPKFCLQINSEEKPGFVWSGGGTAYIARGTASGSEDRFFLDYQLL